MGSGIINQYTTSKTISHRLVALSKYCMVDHSSTIINRPLSNSYLKQEKANKKKETNQQ